jgi:hypothetical protein
VRPFTNGFLLIDLKSVRLENSKAVSGLKPQFLERREAAPIPFDRSDTGAGIEECLGEAAWPWSDLIDALPMEIAWDCRDPRQQLTIENEILSKSLACAKPVPCNDLA